MKITLIRHTSVDVPKGVCYGQTDVPLNSTFEQEANEVFSRLTHRTFDKVYTSPLSRCVRLASYCGFPYAEKDNRLMELNFGDWEMKSFDEIDDPNLQAWYDDYIHVRATKGESFEDQVRRVSDFLDELREKPYREVALFTHGGVLASAQIYAGLITDNEAFKTLIPYGGTINIEL